MSNFRIEHLNHHPTVQPHSIKGVTYIGGGRRYPNNIGGMLFLLEFFRHDGSPMHVYAATNRRDTGDVRTLSKYVRAAYCRLSGMTNKALAEEVAKYAESQHVDYIAEKESAILDLARGYGFEIEIKSRPELFEDENATDHS